MRLQKADAGSSPHIPLGCGSSSRTVYHQIVLANRFSQCCLPLLCKTAKLGWQRGGENQLYSKSLQGRGVKGLSSLSLTSNFTLQTYCGFFSVLFPLIKQNYICIYKNVSSDIKSNRAQAINNLPWVPEPRFPLHLRHLPRVPPNAPFPQSPNAVSSAPQPTGQPRRGHRFASSFPAYSSPTREAAAAGGAALAARTRG